MSINGEKVINVLGRVVTVWLLFILAESLNGTIRDLFIKPIVGDVRARQISFFAALAIIFTITFIFIRWMRISTNNQLFATGAFWVVLTFGFEALVARPLLNVSWEGFLAEYNILQGGMMFVGMIALALAPFLVAKANRLVARLKDV